MKQFTIILFLILVRIPTYSQVNKTIEDSCKVFVSKVITSSPESFLKNFQLTKSDENTLRYGDLIEISYYQNNQIVPSGSYLIPIIKENNAIALVRVINSNNVFRAVDFGFHDMAAEIQKKSTPKIKNIMRIFEIKQDFIIEKNKNNYTLEALMNNDERKKITFNELNSLIKLDY